MISLPSFRIIVLICYFIYVYVIGYALWYIYQFLWFIGVLVLFIPSNFHVLVELKINISFGSLPVLPFVPPTVGPIAGCLVTVGPSAYSANGLMLYLFSLPSC